MENWLVALIAAGGALGGSALTGVIAYRLARIEREARDASELRAALAAYGAALDRLTIRIDQLPPAPANAGKWLMQYVARWRAFDWVMGRISVATVGRGGMRAIDEVLAATNRLMLVAPDSVLEPMQILSDLISRFEQGDEMWRDEWRIARNEFAKASREAVV